MHTIFGEYKVGGARDMLTPFGPLFFHFPAVFGKNLVNDMFLPQTRGLALCLIKEILVPALTVLHNTAKFRNVSYDYLKFVMVN